MIMAAWRLLGGRRVGPRGACGTAVGGLLPGHEGERERVDAVALPGGAWAVVEDVSEVPAAGAAHDLCPAHEQAVVRSQLDRLRDGRLGEAPPAGAGVELRVRREEHRRAGRAAVLAGSLVVDVVAGEGRLGAGLAQHVVLGRRELLAPLLLGLLDLRLIGGHHACSSTRRQPRPRCYPDLYVHVRLVMRST